MMDAETREFLSASIGALTNEVNRLSGFVERQNNLINQIDIKTTTRVAELQKDIDGIKDEIKEIKAEQRSVDESQKFKWKTLSEERAAEKKEQADKNEKQAVVNQSIGTINKLLWTILGIVLTIGITFVWELIKSGGLRGMTP